MGNYTYITKQPLAIVIIPLSNQEYDKEKWCPEHQEAIYTQDYHRRDENWDKYKFCPTCATPLEVKTEEYLSLPDTWYEWQDGPNCQWQDGAVSSQYLTDRFSSTHKDKNTFKIFMKSNNHHNDLDNEKLNRDCYKSGEEKFQVIPNQEQVENFKGHYKELLDKLVKAIPGTIIEYTYGILTWSEW